MRLGICAIHVCAMLALGQAGCHGRPLQSQLAAGRAPVERTARGAGEWQGIPEGRLARRMRRYEPSRPPVLTEQDLEIVRRARALRNPRNWTPRGGCPTAVDRAAALAREFAGPGNPAKATRPGSVGIDVGGILRAILKRRRR